MIASSYLDAARRRPTVRSKAAGSSAKIERHETDAQDVYAQLRQERFHIGSPPFSIGGIIEYCSTIGNSEMRDSTLGCDIWR